MKTTITQITARRLDIALHTPFGIAAGTMAKARNVIVAVQLEDGTVGLGEAAPFPAVNGETQDDALDAVERARHELLGADASSYRAVSRRLDKAVERSCSARCAIETAVLDALLRRVDWPLWRFFGGAETSLRTDITIVTGTREESEHAAAHAAEQGFDVLKIKIGGGSLEADAERLHAIARAAPDSRWILDANGSISASDATQLVDRLGAERARIALFEQPTRSDDIEGLKEIARRTGIPVAADESARTAHDVQRLAQAKAVQVINIKITKSGLLEALDMIAVAKTAGFGLMIGGMVESALAMTTSACLAAGIGGFDFVDLDTPLFMIDPPTRGGYRQNGATLSILDIRAGHGVTLRAETVL